MVPHGFFAIFRRLPTAGYNSNACIPQGKLTLYADRIIVSQQKGLINLHKNKRQTDLNDLSILALFYFIIKILLLLQMKFAFHHIHGIRGTLKFILDAWMSYV